MDYFKNYTSNTSAGSGNQKYFLTCDEIQTGRIFYRVNCGGEYKYSFLLSNIVDSTFSDGKESHANFVCDQWEILSLHAGICKGDFFGRSFDPVKKYDIQHACNMKQILFNGQKSKTVAPGEFFSTDAVLLNAQTDDYICVEISFRGKQIPFLCECNIPAFKKTGDNWVFSSEMPFIGMLGCNRSVKKRIAFLGDSITQGLGTPINSYAHWNAIISKSLGSDYAFWNLGLGFGRASDAASDGAWLFKAKQNDAVVVCYGVNDIFQGCTEQELKANLKNITKSLHNCGVKVLLQTIPPFNYKQEHKRIWSEVNRYIMNDLADVADAIFDVVPILSVGGNTPEDALYGDHPNEEGCKKWAQALLPVLWNFIK